MIDSRGGIFYMQKRVGKNNIDFVLYKFRTMAVNSDKKGLLTIGTRDNRVTKIGYFLRKYKLDELPQLINVLIGNMSIVGPRPEVRKYVEHYNEAQMKVLTVKPGITDFASIKYYNENEILAKSDEPELEYINRILPEKIILNMSFIDQPNIGKYFKIIYQTIIHILKK
jgi:lipopolysaccharide/colanic/teichoic acid biosynthesis glycosyltransferase